MSKIILGVDFDGVLAATNHLKSRLIEEWFGVRLPAHAANRSGAVPAIGESAYEAIRAQTRSRTLEIAAHDGAAEVLGALRPSVSMTLVTHRPRRYLPLIQEWLRNHEMDGHFTTLTSSHGDCKASVASALGCHALLDDDLRHLINAEEVSGVKPIWFKPGEVRPGDPALPRVCEWTEVPATLDSLFA